MGKKILWSLLAVIVIGFCLPEGRMVPVRGATAADWNADTFWYEPWGTSGVHKGVDIFAKKGTDVVASTHQIILHKGTLKKGGNIILALGPRWRLHYYAHLGEFKAAGRFVKAGTAIASVGDSGNAKGKPPHLHFSIVSVFPYVWLITDETQGWRKAFYLNPIKFFGK